MYKAQFVEQVRLLLQCLPAIRNQNYFALKGGTAINLFVRDLPRLSVDIDLTYKYLANRDESLADIQDGLREMAAIIKQVNPQFTIEEQISKQNGYLLKLLIYHQNTMVKIEPSFIARGTLYPTEAGTLCKQVNKNFNAFLDKVPMLAHSELYAGKLCAALNRQHPRDLFDIKLLLESEGITDKMRQAFVVYLAGDSRPIHELLSPNFLDIQTVFEREFSKITDRKVTLKELLSVCEELVRLLNKSLTDKERLFLLSIKEGNPRYDYLPFDNLEKLPAMQWKLMNIRKMDKKKRERMAGKLKAVLGL